EPEPARAAEEASAGNNADVPTTSSSGQRTTDGDRRDDGPAEEQPADLSGVTAAGDSAVRSERA
ncbi:MAG TPA: hypothetical protein VGD43_23480, partial [Micromonospora sp.]